MKKKITVNQLIPEMYVSNLYCPWKPEGKQNLEGRIANTAIVEQLKKRGITEVFIDISRGIDVPSEEQQVQKDEQLIIEEISQDTSELEIKVDVRNEINQALSIYQQARELMDDTLALVRNGKNINAQALIELTEKIATSLSRNPSALMCIGRIRDKDTYLTEHSVNLGVLMGAFSLYQRLSDKKIRENILAGLLHDIAMVFVPNEIMQKQSALTDDEFNRIKSHVEMGVEILSKTPGISENTITAVLQHHERVDGRGYPHGLKGDEISDSGKMIAIGVVYDAITADRFYSRSMPLTTAMKKLLDSCDNHLDTKLVHRFIRIMGVYPVGSLVRLNNDKLAIVMQAGKRDYKAPLVKVIYNAKNKRYLPVEWLDLASAANRQYTIEEAVNPSGWGICVEDFLG